ncbi:MAG: Flp pilus assembly protein CpaB [Bryobacteraceae bacterium]
MRQRVFTILVLALLIATGASYLVYRMVQVRISKNTPVPVSHIVVAARNLEIGTLVRDTDLKMGEWTGAPPKGMATNFQAVVGRGVVAAIYDGEPVLENRLAPKEAGGGLAAIIPPGMRACAVKVNEVVGLAGFVVPGMRVDVLISGNPPNARDMAGTKVKTLLQNIEVLSAGQNIQKDAEGKPVSVQVVNLLVTPEQAEVLSLASNEARIQLVLRNPTDTQVADVHGSAMGILFDQKGQVPPKSERPIVVKIKQAPPAAKPPEPPTFIIEVLNGAKKSEAKFQGAPAEEKQ